MNTPVQTSYNRRMPIAQAGMPASMTGWNTDTKICDDSNGIGFGLAVSHGAGDSPDAGDRGVLLGGTAFVGITLADKTLVHDTADTYELGDNVGLCVEGDIWVETEDTVVSGEEVLYNTTTGALGHNGGVVIEGARWMTSATAGHLAVVRLGNPSGNPSGVTD